MATCIGLAFLALPTLADDAYRTRLAEEYAAIKIEVMLSSFTPELLERRIRAANFELSDANFALVSKMMSQEFIRSSYVMERTISEAALEVFTTEELEALVNFFGSEVGQAVMFKMPEEAARVSELSSQWIAQIQQRVFEELSRR